MKGVTILSQEAITFIPPLKPPDFLLPDTLRGSKVDAEKADPSENGYSLKEAPAPWHRLSPEPFKEAQFSRRFLPLLSPWEPDPYPWTPVTIQGGTTIRLGHKIDDKFVILVPLDEAPKVEGGGFVWKMGTGEGILLGEVDLEKLSKALSRINEDNFMDEVALFGVPLSQLVNFNLDHLLTAFERAGPKLQEVLQREGGVTFLGNLSNALTDRVIRKYRKGERIGPTLSQWPNAGADIVRTLVDSWDNLSPKQKKEIEKIVKTEIESLAPDAFADGFNLRSLYDQIRTEGLFKAISIGGVSLEVPWEVFRAFFDLSNPKIGDDLIEANETKSGTGFILIEVPFRFEEELGGSRYRFTQTTSIVGRVAGRVFAALKLSLDEGVILPELVGLSEEDARALVQLFPGLAVTAPDISGTLSTGFAYESQIDLNESFELTLLPENLTLGLTHFVQKKIWERQTIALKLRLDTENKRATIDYRNESNRTKEDTVGNYLYVTRTNRYPGRWYYQATTGILLETKREERKSRHSTFQGDFDLSGPPQGETKDEKVTISNNDFRVLPQIAASAGTEGAVLNPIATFLTFPEPFVRVGFLLNTPSLFGKLTGQSATSEHPLLETDRGLTLNLATVLFDGPQEDDSDPSGREKWLSFSAEEETIAALPQQSHQYRLDEARHQFALDLTGALFLKGGVTWNGRDFVGEVETVYSFESPLYLGGAWLFDPTRSFYVWEGRAGSDFLYVAGRYGFLSDEEKSQRGNIWGFTSEFKFPGGTRLSLLVEPLQLNGPDEGYKEVTIPSADGGTKTGFVRQPPKEHDIYAFLRIWDTGNPDDAFFHFLSELFTWREMDTRDIPMF